MRMRRWWSVFFYHSERSESQIYNLMCRRGQQNRGPKNYRIEKTCQIIWKIGNNTSNKIKMAFKFKNTKRNIPSCIGIGWLYSGNIERGWTVKINWQRRTKSWIYSKFTGTKFSIHILTFYWMENMITLEWNNVTISEKNLRDKFLKIFWFKMQSV